MNNTPPFRLRKTRAVYPRHHGWRYTVTSGVTVADVYTTTPGSRIYTNAGSFRGSEPLPDAGARLHI